MTSDDHDHNKIQKKGKKKPNQENKKKIRERKCNIWIRFCFMLYGTNMYMKL